MERVVGSAAGAALAVANGFVPQTPLAISMAVFPLVWLTMALRKVSYGLYVAFLTPAFVLVANFASPADERLYVIARLGDNILGVAFAVLATYLLWPKRESDRLADATDEVIRWHLEYLVKSVRSGEHSYEDCESARRMAGLASNNAEEIYKHARLEKRTKETNACFDDAVKTFELLRRIAGVAGRMRVTTQQQGADPALGNWIVTTCESIVGRLHRRPSMARQEAISTEGLGPLEADAVTQLTQLSKLIGKRREAVTYPGKFEPQSG
jgi:uncharacterized membrane protein YccC